MIKIQKINLKKVKVFFEKLPLTLAKNAFRSFIGLFILSLIIGGIIFYQYDRLVKNVEPETSKEFKFLFKTYEEILTIWQKKETELERTNYKQYSNPFFP